MELKPSKKQVKGNEPVNNSEDDSFIKKERKNSKPTLHDFLVKKCQSTHKRAHFHSVKRNSLEKIGERYTCVTRWEDMDMDFLRNCVFIDEAGFHINMKRNYTWPQKGARAVVIVPELYLNYGSF
ncbi:hypothetical protein J3Q64DRAFT_1847675 [Phycomyces blakesleeanus]|uniref:DDE-1 domain-containing protein n=1 Tax=Phycomyces blakesleeanus TaxID=4837 RepID=A0ABR3B4L3_PHYBL